jgi:CBS domain-containing protein
MLDNGHTEFAQDPKRSRAMYVADILKAKGTKVITIGSDASIEMVAQRLKMERVGALVVSETGATAEGIISERDVAHGLAEHGAEVLRRKAADLMTRDVVTCSPSDIIAHVAKLMTDRRIRHMPVTQGKKLVGIISIGDVVKFRLDELQLEANVMRDYIGGGE